LSSEPYQELDTTIAKILRQSASLLAAIKEYEANKWKVIGQKVGKPAKVNKPCGVVTLFINVADLTQACEQYAKEHFGGKM
jgi:hypothetical protein